MEIIIPLSLIVLLFSCSIMSWFDFKHTGTFAATMLIFIFSFATYLSIDEVKRRKSERVEATVISDATVTRDGVKYPVFIEKFGITTIVSSPKYTFKKGDRITMNYEYHTR